MNPLRRALIPPHCGNVPEEVAAAEEALVEAVTAVESGAGQLRQAEQEAEAAPKADAEAAAAAVTAGKPVPAGTEPKAREEVEIARRTFAVLQRTAAERLAERDRAITAAAGAWIEDQRTVVEEAAGVVDDLLDRLGAAYNALDGQATILAKLEIRAEGTRLAPQAARWDHHGRVPRTGVHVRPDGSRQRLTPRPVDPQPDALIGALREQARGLVPESAEDHDAEDLRRRKDFQETRRAWARLAEGGIHVGSGGQ